MELADIKSVVNRPNSRSLVGTTEAPGVAGVAGTADAAERDGTPATNWKTETNWRTLGRKRAAESGSSVNRQGGVWSSGENPGWAGKAGGSAKAADFGCLGSRSEEAIARGTGMETRGETERWVESGPGTEWSSETRIKGEIGEKQASPVVETAEAAVGSESLEAEGPFQLLGPDSGQTGDKPGRPKPSSPPWAKLWGNSEGPLLLFIVARSPAFARDLSFVSPDPHPSFLPWEADLPAPKELWPTIASSPKYLEGEDTNPKFSLS
ncbi:hypothetical protein HWI79_1626 [Cryptosporidium felis]|nr:hypothetical protein HWI79_1626 [Cryptosporidium felis]